MADEYAWNSFMVFDSPLQPSKVIILVLMERDVHERVCWILAKDVSEELDLRLSVHTVSENMHRDLV
jgi:hypothetical protein